MGSAGRVLYHVERSILLRKGATCILSEESGVEGVVGEGEREAEAACEEEEDMIDGRKEGEKGREEGGEERMGKAINQFYVCLCRDSAQRRPPFRLHNSLRM